MRLAMSVFCLKKIDVLPRDPITAGFFDNAGNPSFEEMDNKVEAYAHGIAQ